MNLRENAGGRLGGLLPRLVLAAIATVIVAGALEGGAYLFLRWEGWFNSWQYVTKEDRSLGFTLRPGIHSRWSRVDVHVNESGVRDRSSYGQVDTKAPDEILVLCVGDSNTFGNGTPYDGTYAALLESRLQRSTADSVRVVNLGVPGYTNEQALLRLKEWLYLDPDVVVFADAFNNRVPTRGPHGRVYEYGGMTSYLLVALRKLIVHPTPTQLPLSVELPITRVPVSEYGEILDAVVALSRSHGFSLVLLATGDAPDVSVEAVQGLRYLASSDWKRTLEVFHRLREIHPELFLPWYYERKALVELAQHETAEEISQLYAVSPVAGFRYLDRAVHFADEYISVMRDVGMEEGVPMVDVRKELRDREIHFRDIAHFSQEGHSVIAEALEAVIAPNFPDRP